MEIPRFPELSTGNFVLSTLRNTHRLPRVAKKLNTGIFFSTENSKNFFSHLFLVEIQGSNQDRISSQEEKN